MPTPDKSGCTKTGLYYAIYGTGQPLLAIHGLGASMYSWRKFVEEKNTFPGYQIILIDLKGSGNSAKPHDKNYSILTQRDLVLQFIQELNLKNLTLVGNSYGGAVSLLVAIELCKPQGAKILSKLILIDSGGYDLLLPWYLKLLRTPVLGWLALHLLSARQAADTVLKNAYYNEASDYRSSNRRLRRADCRTQRALCFAANSKGRHSAGHRQNNCAVPEHQRAYLHLVGTER